MHYRHTRPLPLKMADGDYVIGDDVKRTLSIPSAVFNTILGLRPRTTTSDISGIALIDLQALSDAIFFGLGNLGLKIVAMSLCYGSTQSEPATDRPREPTCVVR